MRGVVFLAATAVVLMISIGSCTLPLVVMSESGFDAVPYLLEVQFQTTPTFYSFADKIACDSFAATLRAIGAFVILACIATGVTTIIVALKLFDVLKLQLPVYIGAGASIVFTVGAFAFTVECATSVFCGNQILNHFLHPAGGFVCMIAASIVTIAAGITVVIKRFNGFALALYPLSLVLCIGACLVPPISGVNGSYSWDITLFNIQTYVVAANVKLQDLGCEKLRAVYSAIAAFIILTSIAVGVMLIAEIVSMVKSLKTRAFTLGATALAILFSLLASALQVYGFTGTFCEGSYQDDGHLAGGFVCSILVLVLTSAIAVLMSRDIASGGSVMYSPMEDEQAPSPTPGGKFDAI
ncbi:amastin, putative [Bodo saltans]|uniref:Amastin, putative n=1 Tax=Bodo saltans TaxID=75058 RepID=A0A0S4J5S4_BODSA|nr:amastin, putative [Bodo saltans]|eukprot:CUG86795.1 amastin, putative [Bodo saltans]